MDIISWKSLIASIRDIGTVLKRWWEGGEIKSFEEKQKAEEAVSRRDLGIRVVPVRQIVGSVGRYHDFDSHFRLKEDHPPDRLEHIKEAMRKGKILPPVELYKIKDEYYVLDGNHRVAAAKALGQDYIDAHVVEYLPSKETLENILYRERADFEWKTGLSDPVILTEVGQYAHLLGQITEHHLFLEQQAGTTLSLKQAAKDWYETIYKPLVTIIERSRLVEAFPGRTVADLYAYITYQQWQKGREREYGIELDRLIPKSMEEFRKRMTERQVSGFPEMKRVTIAFLLINVLAGREDQVMEELFKHKEVQEIHFVPGDFDIIAKIAVERDWLSSDSEVIGQFVHDRVRRLPGVTQTRTIIPISSRRK